MRDTLAIKQRFGIITQSPLLEQALDTALRVASTDLTVLITGESGVGKEVFSKIIHALSPRKHNPFIAINCGAIPEGTINSELFGHEKGAFTGATGDRKGYFETVNGGTIFLDEIGEMPLDTQSYLLRVLESGEFIRVGSSQVHKTDVRVVAATNVDLRERIARGKFRDDLYYRLNTVPIAIPPLRERREDIPLLFRKFSMDIAEKYRTTPIQLDEESRKVLFHYLWPGNVRELKNIAEQLAVLSDQKLVQLHTLQQLLPHLFERPLPALREEDRRSDQTTMQEREILYKLLFDMKNDLTDLKKLVFELIRSNDLQVTDVRPFLALQEPERGAASGPEGLGFHDRRTGTGDAYYEDVPPATLHPLIVERPNSREDDLEVMDDNLRLEGMEKDMIRKALQKHRGRRRDAAAELGISERTLYRKIKQYDLV